MALYYNLELTVGNLLLEDIILAGRAPIPQYKFSANISSYTVYS